jgi:hypothetical protein
MGRPASEVSRPGTIVAARPRARRRRHCESPPIRARLSFRTARGKRHGGSRLRFILQRLARSRGKRAALLGRAVQPARGCPRATSRDGGAGAGDDCYRAVQVIGPGLLSTVCWLVIGVPRKRVTRRSTEVLAPGRASSDPRRAQTLSRGPVVTRRCPRRRDRRRRSHRRARSTARRGSRRRCWRRCAGR